MKTFTMAVALFLIAYSAAAQTGEVIRYYDESWKEVSPDSAYYMTKFTPKNNLFFVQSYIKQSGKLSRTSWYKTADFSKMAEGTVISYYENGQVEDSLHLNGMLAVTHARSYYPDGKLRAIYTYDPSTKKEKTTGYDKSGKVIEGYIYQREADFPGGMLEWQKFIQNSKLTYNRKTPPGDYKLLIQFVIGEDGKVRDAKPLSEVGYGMEESAVKAIKKSPKWIPAMKNNEPVKAYRLQPFTIRVAEATRR